MKLDGREEEEEEEDMMVEEVVDEDDDDVEIAVEEGLVGRRDGGGDGDGEGEADSAVRLEPVRKLLTRAPEVVPCVCVRLMMRWQWSN